MLHLKKKIHNTFHWHSEYICTSGHDMQVGVMVAYFAVLWLLTFQRI